MDPPEKMAYQQKYTRRANPFYYNPSSSSSFQSGKQEFPSYWDMAIVVLIPIKAINQFLQLSKHQPDRRSRENICDNSIKPLLGSESLSHETKPRWISSEKGMCRSNICITGDTGAPLQIPTTYNCLLRRLPCCVRFCELERTLEHDATGRGPSKTASLIKSYYSSTRARIRVSW